MYYFLIKGNWNKNIFIEVVLRWNKKMYFLKLSKFLERVNFLIKYRF